MNNNCVCLKTPAYYGNKTLKKFPNNDSNVKSFYDIQENKHLMEFQECCTCCIINIYVCCTLSFNLCSFLQQ